MSELPPGDKRQLLVDEIQELVKKANNCLEMRDNIPYRIGRRPKGAREMEFERLAEEYAEFMVVIEEKHAELRSLEKSLKIYGADGK